MSSRRHPSAASNRSNTSCSRRRREVRRASSLAVVLGSSSTSGVGGQLVLQQTALLSAPSGQPGERADRRQLVGRAGSGCLPVRQAALGGLEVLGRCDESLSAVRGPGGQHSFVLGDPFAELAVEYPGVAACCQGWVGPASKRTGDLFSRVPPVGNGTAVVDGRDRGRCSRCGWAGGNGTGRCSPGRRPRRRCRASGRLPRCRPAPRPPCAPTRAKGWENRPCGCPARTSPAGS